MDAIESVYVDTVAGTYRVDVVYDDDPYPPEFNGCGIAWDGSNSSYASSHIGDDAREILSIIQAYGYKASPAAIARYVRLRFGYPLVWDVYRTGGNGLGYAVGEPSTDRTEHCEGLVWAPVDATDPEQYARGMVAEFSAWASGHVYGYVVTDPSGEKIDRCYGFYPDESETPKSGELWSWGLNYMYQDALSQIHCDADNRVRQANLPTAGFVGLI